jgi:hypothetical protein
MKFLNWLKQLLSDPNRPFWRVLFFGAVGGGLGLAAALVLRENNHVSGEEERSWFFLLCANVALGAGAALVAVFALAGTKADDVYRCCALALLAGFFWRPVFDAGKGYLLIQEERQQEANVIETMSKLEKVNEELKKSSTNPALINEGSALAAALSQQTAALRNSPVKPRANLTVTRYLDTVSTRAGTNNVDALDAVERVADVAERAGNAPATFRAHETLLRIPVTTNANNPAFIRREEIIKRRRW